MIVYAYIVLYVSLRDERMYLVVYDNSLMHGFVMLIIVVYESKS